MERTEAVGFVPVQFELMYLGRNESVNKDQGNGLPMMNKSKQEGELEPPCVLTLC